MLGTGKAYFNSSISTRPTEEAEELATTNNGPKIPLLTVNFIFQSKFIYTFNLKKLY